jgi:hypothetical protein
MPHTIEWTPSAETRLREYLQIPAATPLPSRTPELSSSGRAGFEQFGFEWHLVPPDVAAPFDERYVARCYPTASDSFFTPLHHGDSVYGILKAGHLPHQGRFIAVERTPKPGYLPGNQQCYGTPYGFLPAADPLVPYMGRAGFTTGTRFNHDYGTLSELLRLIQADWSGAGWLPAGYRVSICPPVVFNLVGAIFHPEWSATASLELGFYRDPHGNAQCFAVGPNGPNDYSYVHQVETDSEWPLLGFRLALVPDAAVAR